MFSKIWTGFRKINCIEGSNTIGCSYYPEETRDKSNSENLLRVTVWKETLCGAGPLVERSSQPTLTWQEWSCGKPPSSPLSSYLLSPRRYHFSLAEPTGSQWVRATVGVIHMGQPPRAQSRMEKGAEWA